MPFPLSAKGSFVVIIEDPSIDHAHIVTTTFQEWLEENNATEITRTQNGVAFKVEIGRPVSRWNILAPVTRGSIDVRLIDGNLRVSYKLYFTATVIVGTAMAAPIGLFTVGLYFALKMNSKEASPFLLIIAPLAWLWLVGMNYLVSTLRIRAALRRLAIE